MKTARTIQAVDLFCGAGGTSTGLRLACDRLGYELNLLAVNHWDIAIATHSANHPNAAHMCASVDTVDPRIAVPGGRLDLLWASPECTFFSVARGGKPVTDQGRASAWLILRWAELLYIDTILIENVKEFRDWCPVGVNGRPMKSKRGETFYAFLGALQSLGYRVEWEIMNAADFGAATSRERLFIQARRGRKPITWPKPSHHKNGGRLKKWRAAREIIDWKTPSQSIFGRKRPLAPTTLARIIAGLEKFGGRELEPFLVILRNHATAQSLDIPIPTLTAGGNHVGLAQPFITAFRGNHKGKNDGERRNHSVDEPLRTMDTAPRFGLIEPKPFILGHRQFDESCVDSIERPLRTITASGGTDMGIVEPKPFILPHRMFGGMEVDSIDRPLRTIVANNDAAALVEPFIVPVNHGKNDTRSHSVERPLPTVTSVDATGLVEPYLTKYYGTAKVLPITEPVPTVTTKERFGLVTPLIVETEGGQKVGLDIHFRMLTPRELARAMSFPDSYKFTGNRESVVKQIGNAVDASQSAALCEAVLG
jgi:DNA (cytosine-5)-methyltransferase 1